MTTKPPAGPSDLRSILERIVPKNIAGLPVYQPGKPVEEVERELGITGAIKLASNESASGPSPLAIAAIREALERVNEYPDGGAFRLRHALAAHLGVEPTELVFGAGSNEIIYLAIRALCHPGTSEVITHEYAFMSYRIATLAHGALFVSSETTKLLGCDIDDLLAKVTAETRVVFLANPNNPTGAHVSPTDLERVVRELRQDILLVVDEAYFEYAIRSGVPYKSSLELRHLRPLMLTLRTFSKIYGLAGLRVGYGVGAPALIDVIGRARRPFNVNALAQAAATAALADNEHIERAARAGIDGVAQLREAASGLGVSAYPSLGNFVLFDVGRDSEEVAGELAKRGVIIRPMKAWGLPTAIRITTGTAEQNRRAIDALAEVLRG